MGRRLYKDRSPAHTAHCTALHTPDGISDVSVVVAASAPPREFMPEESRCRDLSARWDLARLTSSFSRPGDRVTSGADCMPRQRFRGIKMGCSDAGGHAV